MSFARIIALGDSSGSYLELLRNIHMSVLMLCVNDEEGKQEHLIHHFRPPTSKLLKNFPGGFITQISESHLVQTEQVWERFILAGDSQKKSQVQLKWEALDYNPEKPQKECLTVLSEIRSENQRGSVSKRCTRRKYEEQKQWACQLISQLTTIKRQTNMKSGFQIC